MMFPLAVVAGIVLVARAETRDAGIAAVIFATTAVLLFGSSALLHRGSWTPRVKGLLRRMDHSNIYLIIAGTYTPFAVLSLPPSKGRSLLLIVWIGVQPALFLAPIRSAVDPISDQAAEHLGIADRRHTELCRPLPLAILSGHGITGHDQIDVVGDVAR